MVPENIHTPTTEGIGNSDVVESWESHVTQKPRGTERVVLLDTFRCIVCLYIKVLLEFLWIMRPRLLIIAPVIRLQVVESLN